MIGDRLADRSERDAFLWPPASAHGVKRTDTEPTRPVERVPPPRRLARPGRRPAMIALATIAWAIMRVEAPVELSNDERVGRALRARRDIIDITTVGRRTGEPRRIEIVFHNIGGRIYISGMPAPVRRAWLANLEADPRFTFHLKRTVSADLPARARIVKDDAERRQVFAEIIVTAWRDQDLETMVRLSPLIEVAIEALAA